MLVSTSNALGFALTLTEEAWQGSPARRAGIQREEPRGGLVAERGRTSQQHLEVGAASRFLLARGRARFDSAQLSKVNA
jgi:hypothetical protein